MRSQNRKLFGFRLRNQRGDWLSQQFIEGYIKEISYETIKNLGKPTYQKKEVN